MKGIKSHTHEERKNIIDQIISLLKSTFTDNFVALAADGSYARNEDTEYSDLELIVFLHTVQDPKWSIRKIIDGMLVVVVPDTQQSYIEKYIEISEIWYASGAGKLLPIVNKKYIETINKFSPIHVQEKCLQQIQKIWPQYQEITAKVLNTCNQHDQSALPLIMSLMIKEIVIILSFLNMTPYKTLGTYITQAKAFSIKPKKFDELLYLYNTGVYVNRILLKTISIEIFSEFETLLEKKGLQLNAQGL